MRPSLLAILLALSACGDDSGGADAAGDPADAPDQMQADAPDQMQADAPDPMQADAGNVTGLDQVCTCDPSTACPDELDCFVNTPSPPHFLRCEAGSDAGIGESGV